MFLPAFTCGLAYAAISSGSHRGPAPAVGQLVGRHDDQDPVLNVYAELYRLLGAEPPDGAGRRRAG